MAVISLRNRFLNTKSEIKVNICLRFDAIVRTVGSDSSWKGGVGRPLIALLFSAFECLLIEHILSQS